MLLAISLPFAAIQPIIRTPWLAVTDDKLFVLVAVLAWLASGGPSVQEINKIRPAVMLVAIAAVSAVASDFPQDALKATAHLAAVVLVLLLTLRVARAGLLWAIVAGAAASAALGVAEGVGWPAVSGLLGAFKVAPTLVAGELRVSASFQYATIAAMYFEMVVPIAIALAASASSRGARWAATGAAMLCTAVVVLTLTRAGMLTIAIVMAIIIALAVGKHAYRRLLWPALSVGAVLGSMVVVDIARDPVFDLRLVTENDADWYGAVYSAPAQLDINGDATVSVDVRNAGRMTWSPDDAHPFALGYRWLTADGSGVINPTDSMVRLPREVRPGETTRIDVQLDAHELPNGTYRVGWGMVQQDVVQFYERGWPNAETIVHVTNSAVTPPPTILPRDDSEAPWVVPRVNLWQAAIGLIQRHPVLGVGPDNFRHLYGAELGLDSWDERVQANNLYLELLVDMGVLGLLAFAWLVIPPLVRLARRLRQPVTTESFWLLGVGLAVLAFLLHGLLDTFLSFTPTALLFAICLGFLLAQKPHVSGRW